MILWNAAGFGAEAGASVCVSATPLQPSNVSGRKSVARTQSRHQAPPLLMRRGLRSFNLALMLLRWTTSRTCPPFLASHYQIFDGCAIVAVWVGLGRRFDTDIVPPRMCR